MKQTNYHLFDFMDFDPSLQKDEALWKAYAPSKVEERNGDIAVAIPYQKQLHQEDMAPDTAVPQQSFDLIIRAYEPNIVRLFTTMSGDEMTEADDMLMMAKEVKRLPLTVRGFCRLRCHRSERQESSYHRPQRTSIRPLERPATGPAARTLHHLLSRW